MLIRPKVFLTSALICISPLVALSLLSLRNSLNATRGLLRSNVSVDSQNAIRLLDAVEKDRETELLALVHTPAMHNYLRATRGSNEHKPAADQRRSSRVMPDVATAGVSSDATFDARVELGARLGQNRKYYSSIVVFDSTSQPIFVEELQTRPDGAIVLQRHEWSFNQFGPDPRVWSLRAGQVICEIARHASMGQVLRCSVPIFTSDKNPATAALVADIKLDQLISDATRHWDLPTTEITSSESAPERMIVVLDSSEHIVYHTNSALRHQIVSSSMPHFAPVADKMISGQSGIESFKSPEGNEWLVAYLPNKSSNVFFSEAINYTQAVRAVWLNGWILVVVALLMGLAAALLLARYLGEQRDRIARVTQGLDAIAKGDLNHRIEALSSDSIRPLSDNLNLMTAQLREQIARETEARQFQSFVRLSAMLTHDLKNAIEALSLIVSNMERHFDNPEFRADAMKSLNVATKNLRSLVDRLSTPVTTLSGEYKRPQPVDVVSLLKRVISLTAEPAGDAVQIQMKLPASLGALIDAERIERVMENLILNGIEAMAGRGGTLSVEAGPADLDQVYFSVSDTGSGMTRDFVEHHLYRPFATTKQRGVGLGLYACREVVRANDGTIEVDSREGAGTTFRVVLPSAPIERPK